MLLLRHTMNVSDSIEIRQTSETVLRETVGGGLEWKLAFSGVCGLHRKLQAQDETEKAY